MNERLANRDSSLINHASASLVAWKKKEREEEEAEEAQVEIDTLRARANTRVTRKAKAADAMKYGGIRSNVRSGADREKIGALLPRGAVILRFFD